MSEPTSGPSALPRRDLIRVVGATSSAMKTMIYTSMLVADLSLHLGGPFDSVAQVAKQLKFYRKPLTILLLFNSLYQLWQGDFFGKDESSIARCSKLFKLFNKLADLILIGSTVSGVDLASAPLIALWGTRLSQLAITLAAVGSLQKSEVGRKEVAVGALFSKLLLDIMDAEQEALRHSLGLFASMVSLGTRVSQLKKEPVSDSLQIESSSGVPDATS